jgi:hypothetical protein
VEGLEPLPTVAVITKLSGNIYPRTVTSIAFVALAMGEEWRRKKRLFYWVDEVRGEGSPSPLLKKAKI